MDNIFGIPVLVIRPGDQFHPGDDKIYFINLLEMKKALDDIIPDPNYNPWAWKVQPKVPPFEPKYLGVITNAGT